jgi:hypothetical protein
MNSSRRSRSVSSRRRGFLFRRTGSMSIVKGEGLGRGEIRSCTWRRSVGGPGETIWRMGGAYKIRGRNWLRDVSHGVLGVETKMKKRGRGEKRKMGSRFARAGLFSGRKWKWRNGGVGHCNFGASGRQGCISVLALSTNGEIYLARN